MYILNLSLLFFTRKSLATSLLIYTVCDPKSFTVKKEEAKFELDTMFLCSTEIHGADAGIACRIIMISFGHFRLQMT